MTNELPEEEIVIPWAIETEKGHCDKHDIDCDFRIIKAVNSRKSLCPKCIEENDLMIAKREQEEVDRLKAVAKEKEQKDLNNRIDNAMVSPRFKLKTFDNYISDNPKQGKYVSELETFCDNLTDGTGYILLGTTGTGKNHLASACINKVVNNGGTGLFITVAKLVRSIKDGWRQEGVREQDIISTFTKPDLLVIDELGVQFESAMEKNILTEVINDRYEYMKPTILIGNLTVDEIKELLGDRVIDRFREGGKVLILDWESYRGK